MTKKEIIAGLAELVPGAQKVVLRYEGGGDDFDSFNSLVVLDDQDKNIGDLETYEIEQTIIKLTQDYIFDVIFAQAECSPDFNNEGSSGTVTFDLLNRVITLENSYWRDATEYPDEDAGEDPDDYEYEEEEEKCDPEIF
jgi:hypothetical protein